MRRSKKIWKRLLYVLGGFLLLLVIGCIYLYSVAVVDPPDPADKSSLELRRKEMSSGFYTIKNSWFRHTRPLFIVLIALLTDACLHIPEYYNTG